MWVCVYQGYNNIPDMPDTMPFVNEVNPEFKKPNAVF
jgi:hypothetical protein